METNCAERDMHTLSDTRTIHDAVPVLEVASRTHPRTKRVLAGRSNRHIEPTQADGARPGFVDFGSVWTPSNHRTVRRGCSSGFRLLRFDIGQFCAVANCASRENSARGQLKYQTIGWENEIWWGSVPSSAVFRDEIRNTCFVYITLQQQGLFSVNSLVVTGFQGQTVFI